MSRVRFPSGADCSVSSRRLYYVPPFVGVLPPVRRARPPRLADIPRNCSEVRNNFELVLLFLAGDWKARVFPLLSGSLGLPYKWEECSQLRTRDLSRALTAPMARKMYDFLFISPPPPPPFSPGTPPSHHRGLLTRPS
ncbi:unnamed protein product [Chrysodeixis includens]|uniref:Uncharacterized protein n=1 Tax=Chrysodeixis includens TaxID=689277 RepID=A0A9N8KZE9_CHRIL|nr:unnamed protein product [Chrysodeixis includens]